MKVNATIYRDGKWWVAHCAINGKFRYGTQARRLSELDEMILDAAKTIDYDPNQLEVIKKYKLDPVISQYKQASEEAKAAKERLGVVARKTAASLRKENLTVRDIANLMGITPTRVSQLLSS